MLLYSGVWNAKLRMSDGNISSYDLINGCFKKFLLQQKFSYARWF